MTLPVCTYCHIEMFDIGLGHGGHGWICIKCHSTIGREAPAEAGPPV